MKSIVVQLIFILAWAALAVPFFLHVHRLEEAHIKWRNSLAADAEKAREEGRTEEATKLYETSYKAFNGFGLPWYARSFWPYLIIFVLGFIVYMAFDYIGLGSFLEVNEDVDYF